MPTVLKDRLELLDALNLRNKCCAEIGVLKGDFSAEILKREPFDLYMVDPWLHQNYADYNMQVRDQSGFDDLYLKVLERFKGNHHAHVVKLFSHEGAREINRQFDFCYIDARHDFTSVLADLCLWTSKMKSGGVIGLHDVRKSTFHGVLQAIERYVEMTGYEIIYETDESAWTSAAIRVN